MMFKKLIPTLALLALFSTSAVAKKDTCKISSEAEIAGLFDTWNTALQSGDPAQVVQLYSANSVLLPTMSNTPRLTTEAKKDYFAYFLKNKPKGKINSRTISLGCNNATDTGLYTFVFDNGSATSARYTFTYQWNGKNWMIDSHHSSAMPEKS